MASGSDDRMQGVRRHGVTMISRFWCVLILCALAGASSVWASESEDYRALQRLAATNDLRRLKAQSRRYFKKYPRGAHVAPVRHLLASLEHEPRRRLEQLRIIVDRYRYYPRRVQAQAEICEIRYLQSRWDDLAREARQGIALSGNGPLLFRFKLFLVKAEICRGRYDSAKRICGEVIESDHDYADLSEAVLLRSYIERCITGESRRYLESLRDAVQGFQDSPSAPSSIFLLGRFYQSGGDYDRSQAAYSDILRRFPASPEAGLARRRIAEIARFNPRPVDYLPGKKQLDQSSAIDIRPEVDREQSEDRSEDIIAYSIALGPFKTETEARDIVRMVRRDFGGVRIVRQGRGYRVYVEQVDDSEEALAIRVRLAEELGLNGVIVQMVRKSNRQYIYGE